ncbi:MAG TPA: nucleotidyltransferase family protein [Actinomycetota bacterium]|nr:nucleotidyltransferase family protein [Actinomycetota bacterium]
MRDFAFLRWAAGADVDAPGDVARARDEAVEALRYHGLVGRFLRRVERDGDRSVDPVLVDELRSAHDDDRRLLRAQLSAVEGALHELRPHGDPVILKGATVYALTGDPCAIHRGVDVDLVVERADDAVEGLQEAGFELEKDHGTPYEAGGLARGGARFDVHRYYPVFSYPPRLARRDASPEANPGEWCGFAPMRARRVAAPAFAGAAVPGRTADTARLLFPCPELAALVTCGHLMNSFHLSSTPPKLRLGEVCDVAELLRLPSFSRARFEALVDEYAGHDAVGLTRHVATCAGIALPAWLSHVSRRDDFYPRELWWGHGSVGFLVDTDGALTFEDLVRRSFDATALVGHLGGNDVVAGTGDDAVRYATSPAGDGHRVTRVLVAAGDDGRADVSFSLTWSGDTLVIDVRLDARDGDADDVVLLNFGDLVLECRRGARTAPAIFGTTRGRLLRGEVSCETHGERRMLVTLDRRASDEPSRPCASLLLGARRSARWRPQASTLVPLTVHRT